jgi:hypothetical protein
MFFVFSAGIETVNSILKAAHYCEVYLPQKENFHLYGSSR